MEIFDIMKQVYSHDYRKGKTVVCKTTDPKARRRKRKVQRTDSTDAEKRRG